jgi:hypothetical protein
MGSKRRLALHSFHLGFCLFDIAGAGVIGGGPIGGGEQYMSWIALEDEISTTSGVNPVDFCYCEWCTRGLRSLLKRRYRSVESLRASWDRAFVSFENAVPERTADALQRNKELELEKMNFSSWNDHREFMDKSLVASVRMLGDAVRQRDPSLLSEWQVYRLVDIDAGPWAAFQFLVRERLREDGVDVRPDGTLAGR